MGTVDLKGMFDKRYEFSVSNWTVLSAPHNSSPLFIAWPPPGSNPRPRVNIGRLQDLASCCCLYSMCTVLTWGQA